MKYKQYPNCTKTFVVVRNTGFGVMESPYEEHEVVFEHDDLDVAKAESKSLTERNNTPEQIKSSWIPNTYQINVNTLSESGKKLEQEFDKDFDERIANGNYDVKKIGDITFFVPPSADNCLSDTSQKFPTRIAYSEKIIP